MAWSWLATTDKNDTTPRSDLSMTKATKQQIALMRHEAHQVRRAISIMASLGRTNIEHKGKPVPGLSIKDWELKARTLEDAADRKVFIDPELMNDDLLNFQHDVTPDDFGVET